MLSGPVDYIEAFTSVSIFVGLAFLVYKTGHLIKKFTLCWIVVAGYSKESGTRSRAHATDFEYLCFREPGNLKTGAIKLIAEC
jgi:hypothetical protein